MKTQLFLILVATFIFSYGFTQTNVSGPYFSNETWTIEGSPYRVIGDVQIPIGYSLTIEPGVVVEYTGEFEILIKGSLNVIGTESDSICFSCSPEIYSGVTMLRFVDVDFSNSQISFSKFLSSEKAIYTLGSCTDTLLINSTSFSYSEILFWGNNSMVNMNGIHFKNQEISSSGNNSTTKISNSIIDSSYLISAGGNYNAPGMIVNNSEVCNSSFLSNQEMRVMELNNIKCDNCTFSTYYGILTINDSKIINSGFNNHNTAQQCQVFFNISRSFLIDTSIESTVTNINNEWVSFIDIDSCIIKKDSSTLIGYSAGNISNSIIIGTYNNPGILITSGDFYNVTIVNNDIGIFRKDINLSFSVTNSNIFHNSAYNLQNNSTVDISGINNYWGTSDVYEIGELIYDYYDDINLGEVDFANFQNTPNPDCPISPPRNLTITVVSDSYELSWDSNPENDIVGYRLYYGQFDGFEFQYSIDLGIDTTYTIPNGFTYDTIALTAYDDGASGSNDMVNGHESWHSIIQGLLFNSVPEMKNPEQKCIVSPNPVNNTLRIQVIGLSDIIKQTDIIDINGVIMYSMKINSGRINHIDISKFPNGVYFVKTILGSSTDIQKIIKN